MQSWNNGSDQSTTAVSLDSFSFFSFDKTWDMSQGHCFVLMLVVALSWIEIIPFLSASYLDF